MTIGVPLILFSIIYFIRPLVIPTGSMQPTLYAIYPYRDEQRSEPPLPYLDGKLPSLPERLFGIIVQGKIYESAGYRSRGDHFIVDRVTYHFRKPQRGDVIVFDSSEIDRLPEGTRGKLYIKRLIGLGGDTIQIKPPYVLVNSNKLDSLPAFERIYSRTNGYSGYVLAPGAEFFHNAGNIYKVPPGELFVLGDNSRGSLDSRFFGSFPEHAVIGRAILVYWPISKRFGWID